MSNSETLEGIVSSFGKKPLVQKKATSCLHEFYLSGYISEPEDYIEWFDTIRHASPEDTVKIYINSGGGDLFTAVQFLRVLSETEAKVVISVEGICASAATIVFLCADVFEITPHSMFLFHTYSGGTHGKGNEMYAQLAHEKKWSEKLFAEVYEGFLAEKEIEDMILSRDIWMDADEVAERMNRRIEKLKAQEQTEQLAELD